MKRHTYYTENEYLYYEMQEKFFRRIYEFRNNQINMIQVKTFIVGGSNNPLHHERLDAAINRFLSENDVEVIDIKYSICAAPNNGNGWIPSAMLIYKTK